MRKFLIPFFILASCYFSHQEARSQTKLTIKNVSVINEQGHVRISWEYNGTEILEISRDDGNQMSKLQIMNPTDSLFIDLTAQAHIKPRLYKIREIGLSFAFSNFVSTYHLTYKYDSCLEQINLNWGDKVVPPSPPNVDSIVSDWIPSQFIINIFEDGILRTENVDATNEEYTVSGILENTYYTFYIETQWKDQDSKSRSNPIELFTKMPQSPDYINAVSASVEGNNTNLKFDIATNSELDTYKLLKSDSPSGDFDTPETIVTTESELWATDYDSNPDTKLSFYKLVSVNACGNETTNSDIINNIVLEVENNEYENTLKWTLFKEESLTPVNYDIYRIVSNSEPELIGRYLNFNQFQNSIESLQSQSQFCYFIRANAVGAPEGDYSQSNIACMYLEAKVYIPQAFTPNNDGTNDLFKPVYTFIPVEYELRVYNRWGNVIFETGDYSKPWNGRDPKGNSVPTGAYIYYLRLKSPNDQIVEQRGNIMVIYP